MTRVCGADSEMVQAPPDERARLTEQASRFSEEDLTRFFQILLQTDALRTQGGAAELHLFYNSPATGAGYNPVSLRLLPLDAAWRRGLAKLPWPTRNLPEVLGPATATMQLLIGEYLFVSLFRACAESLASENASRLAAMQRAEKNIDDMLDGMNAAFHRLRQSSIDEELFDVVSGFEALSKSSRV